MSAENHRLYLFGGQTFVNVPESAWLNELKSEPAGITALKSVDDSFIMKGWIKARYAPPTGNLASATTWLFEETGAKAEVVVDKDGNISVNGLVVGKTTMGDTFKALEKAAEEVKSGRWVTMTKETMDERGNKIMIPRRIFIPDKKPKDFEPGMGAKKPEDVMRIPAEKGGPHPSTDIMTAQKAMSQLIGKYEPPPLVEKNFEEEHGISDKKVKPGEFEPTSKAKVIQACNLMLDLAEKEENPEERERLCAQVQRMLESCDVPEKAVNPEDITSKARRMTDGTMYPYPEPDEKAAPAKSKLQEAIKDEQSAQPMYRALGKLFPKYKAVFDGIASQEAKHEKKLKRIAG